MFITVAALAVVTVATCGAGVPLLLAAGAGAVAAGGISGLAWGGVTTIAQAAQGNTSASLSDTMDSIGLNMVTGEIGGALSAIPYVGGPLTGVAGELAMNGMINGSIGGTLTNALVSGVQWLFGKTVPTAGATTIYIDPDTSTRHTISMTAARKNEQKAINAGNTHRGTNGKTWWGYGSQKAFDWAAAYVATHVGTYVPPRGTPLFRGPGGGGLHL